MATRRRIGVSAASTEAARRQLMQPVPCWERILVTPEAAPPGSTLKVWKWVKTEKIQHFSDDEGGVDDPLAPLPDEPEVVEGDEELELEETQAPAIAPGKGAESTPALQDEPISKPASPKPQLSMTLSAVDDIVNGDGDADVLDASLKPMVDAEMHDMKKTVVDVDTGVELDISALGPDGLGLDSAHDLSQIDASDGLVGGPLLDQTGDPFGQDVS
ncbi:hypothetical protein P691DRAFT_801232 [Macrolepiota fuliginosa MF-IS2]|uniref:Uncharacterized protein n=1 Tax=Macrolepiota fuliginosa MF-IS2 TaxID=1400762 RepID=A0A9P5XD94_9AGAR|nr:hypothetical protein P691DRAFT_801232 [Macrolepiota fuliginosa MF-IS2]